MVPLVAVPNMQASIPVESSLFSGQISNPQLGRLPYKTVPAAIDNSRVSDQPRNQQQSNSQNSESSETTSASTTSSASGSAASSSLTGKLTSGYPLSTPFATQLFAQIQTSVGLIGGLAGEGTGVPSGFVDFDRLAEFGKVKYKPSNAFAPREKPKQQAEIEAFSASIGEARAKVEAAVRDVAERLAAQRSETQVKTSTPQASIEPTAEIEQLQKVVHSGFESDAGQPAQGDASDAVSADATTPQSKRNFQSLVESLANAGSNAYKATQSRVAETFGSAATSGKQASVSLLL